MLKNIGNWKIIALETGDFRLDGGAMMGSVPQILWRKTNPPDRHNRIDLALRCLLLDDGENRVLIETGLGSCFNPQFIDRFNIQQSKDPLKNRLNENGYTLEDVTHVILTHLHFDHVGGAMVVNEQNKKIPTFSNAKYYISKINWHAGQFPSPRDSASYIKENYMELKNTNQLYLIDDNYEILEGISTYIVNGHTHGQQLVKVSSNQEVLVFCSDLLPLKSHLQLPWIMGYDLNAELTLKEKTEFLNKAAKYNWWLWFYHDPETVAVKIDYGKKYFNIIEEISRSK